MPPRNELDDEYMTLRKGRNRKERKRAVRVPVQTRSLEGEVRDEDKTSK